MNNAANIIAEYDKKQLKIAIEESKRPKGNFFARRWRWRTKMRARYYSASKIFHPKRSEEIFLLLCLSVFFAFLSWFVAFIGLNLIIDDLITDPGTTGLSAISNLIQRRKITKSLINLIGIAIGLVVGALLGYFVFMGIPGALSIIPIIRSGIDTSITMLAIAGLGSILLSKITKISPLFIMLVLGMVIIFAPIPSVFSVGVDVVLSCTLLGGFFAKLISKYVAKGVGKLVGKPDYKSTEHVPLDEELAKVYGVKKAVVHDFRVAILKMIETIKRIRPYYTRISGSEQLFKNPYKDMLHALKNAKADDPKSKKHIEELISINESRDTSLLTYYIKPRKILHDTYGKGQGLSTFFARLGAESNSYSSTKEGYAFRKGMHHFYAERAKAKTSCHDVESMRVYNEYQRSANAFYKAAFPPQASPYTKS